MSKNEISNIIISKDLIIYNAISLYEDNTLFRMPSYLVNEVVDHNRKLLVKHNDKVLRYYTPDELMKSIQSVDKKIHQGVFRREPITFNITVFKI